MQSFSRSFGINRLRNSSSLSNNIESNLITDTIKLLMNINKYFLNMNTDIANFRLELAKWKFLVYYDISPIVRNGVIQVQLLH